MERVYTFSSPLLPAGKEGGVLPIPPEIARNLGTGPVTVLGEGRPLAGGLHREPQGGCRLVLRRRMREKLGKQTGDHLTVTLWTGGPGNPGR